MGKLFIAWSDDAKVASACARNMGEGWYIFERSVGSWGLLFPPPILSSSTHQFAIPFLVLETFSLSLPAMPWIRHLKWRFSLRTLLIATTLVAVALGLAVWAAKS
jgi:hypothetical protein